MGNLGFLFSNEDKQIIIFTYSKKFEGNIILGSRGTLKLEKTRFLFLSKGLKLENFIILDDFKYKFSKINIFNQRIVDFNDFVFYFKPKEYKELKYLFQIENFSDENLIKLTLEIYDYF